MTLIEPSSAGGHLAVRIKRAGDRRSLSRSATRALDVLELFGRRRSPIRAMEIARELEMHPSTTNQLLKTMVDSGHLVFNARDKSYLPSQRLTEFAAWIGEAYGTGVRLRDLILQLQARTGMVVTVSTPNDLFMQVVDLAVPDGMSAQRGLQVSLFGSAVGSAYLSMLEDSEIARLASRARIPAPRIPKLFDEVAQIRREGHADGALEGSPYWSVAMPLPVQGLLVPTVLGLAGPADEVVARLGELSQRMREAITDWTGQPAIDR
ncbi:MAG: helix-turn-helix domain-containing protein [Novosphingobium sp.]